MVKNNNNNTVTFQEQLSSECSCSFMQYFIFYLKPALADEICEKVTTERLQDEAEACFGGFIKASHN